MIKQDNGFLNQVQLIDRLERAKKDLDIRELFSIAHQAADYLKETIDEISRVLEENVQEKLAEDIIGCTELVSFGAYDVDVIVDEIEQTQLTARSVEDLRVLLPIKLPIIRRLLPKLIAQDIMGGPPYMQELGRELGKTHVYYFNVEINEEFVRKRLLNS